MVKVSKIADQDVSTRIDLAALEEYLQSLELPDTYICIACTDGDAYEEDNWQEDGYNNLIIRISYQKLKESNQPFEVIKEEVDKWLMQEA